MCRVHGYTLSGYNFKCIPKKYQQVEDMLVLSLTDLLENMSAGALLAAKMSEILICPNFKEKWINIK